jgi:hypothetical protein
MRIWHRTGWLASASIAFVLTACTSTVTAPSLTEPSLALFAEADLEAIIQSPSDPPDGMKFSSIAAGESYLLVPGRFVPPISAPGFLGGAETEFIPTTSNREPTEAKLDGGLVSGVVLFQDADSASARFAVDALDYKSRQTVGGGIAPVSIISSDELGPDSFGLRGSMYEGAPSVDFVVYIWRMSNLELYVYGWGPQLAVGTVDPADILRVATDMATRVRQGG